MAKLKVIHPTIFKQSAEQAKDLPDRDKVEISEGSEFVLHSYQRAGGHVRVALGDGRSLKGRNTWYAFGHHVQIVEDRKVSPLVRDAVLTSSEVRLAVPYKSQLDNWHNPTGACNVTSLAMCLEYLGAERKTSIGQFEDELYRYMEERGLSRHSPYDLAETVRAYGCSDRFESNATIDAVREWLRAGNPAVTHGYFTSFGHIIAIVGYDDAGLIVHDPYGEWFPGGYRTELSGAFLHYSYNLIARTCYPDGEFWVHFISK